MSNLGKKINRLGPNQQKALLLIYAGVGLSLARTPKQYFRIFKEVSGEWEKINKKSLERAIYDLYKSKLIREHENSDGSITMVLTDKGKKKIITFNIDNLEIKKPKIWDKKWRMVIFDIPEKKRVARDILRETLKRIGFFEFQKSVFVYPYPCQDEIDYLIEYYEIRPYVRIVTATELDNELHMRKIFNIS
jgi:DNA-binding transcriptional regulator PaaX